MALPKRNTLGQLRRAADPMPDLPEVTLPSWMARKYPDLAAIMDSQAEFNEQLLDIISRIQTAQTASTAAVATPDNPETTDPDQPSTFKGNLTLVSSNYTITEEDCMIVVSSSGLVTITMPFTTVVMEQAFYVKNNGSGVVKIVGTELFETSETSILLDAGDSVMLYSTGVRWVIL